MPMVEPLMNATAPDLELPNLEMHGERLSVPERVIVAPCIGQFRMAPPDVVTSEGEIVTAGQIVGHVDVRGEIIPIRSAFTGWYMGSLVHEGERVREGQPVAWLRAV
jgi:multidrug efflux pump subunit AcrA (membrane-fusion protein)